MPDDRRAVEPVVPLAKAEGALLAFAAGDALGWPQEMRRSGRSSAGGAAPRIEFRTWTRRGGGRYRPYEEVIDAGAYSDDTQLTLAVARSRTNHGADWWKAFMQVELPLWTIYERGGGGATKRAAQAWSAGRPPWQSAKADVVRRYFDAGGNGVAMRVLPHALFFAGQDDPTFLVHDVVRDGSATHGHPRALVGATLQAYAAWSLLRRKRTLGFGELLDLLIDERRGWGVFPGSGHGGETWFTAANRTADESYERIWNRTVDEALQLLEVARNGVRAGALADDRAVLDELGCFGRHKGAGTVTAAAAAYLVARHAAQPAQGVIRAAFESGADTDTLAAMTGGLMGCLAGVEWIPGAWFDVQDAGYLRHMAGRVAAGPDGVDCSAVPARPDPRAILSELARNRDGDFVLGEGMHAQAEALADPRAIAKSIAVHAWRLRTAEGQTLYVTKVDDFPRRSRVERSGGRKDPAQGVLTDTGAPGAPPGAVTTGGAVVATSGLDSRRAAAYRGARETMPGAKSQWSSPGAHWWKFDFHTHTPASDDYGRGPEQASLKRIEPADWLLGFMRAEVDCVAVTDHNSGEWLDRLQDAYRELEQKSHPEFRLLHLFPGVEITANGGTHVLAVLDIGKTSADVSTLLGTVRYRGTRGKSDLATEASPIEVVDAISAAGGIPILAHVDEESGAWRLGGNTLTSLLDFDGLYSMEVIDTNQEKPELYRQRRLTWAEVLGSDAHHPSGTDGPRYPGSHYTWVKMAKPSLEGLRLALLDGGAFSIRRSDDPKPFEPFALPRHCVEAIEIGDARYMGRGRPTRLAFSPWLNALVGGRGTGKSTVVHALRLAARREQELMQLDRSSGPRVTFERFNRVPSNRLDRGGLTDKTTIQWTAMRDGVRHRVQWRQDGGGTVVEDDAGGDGWKPSAAQSVTADRFPLRVFSQGQITELAGENQQALLHVIDEAAGVAVLRKKLDEARAAFYSSRARIRELDGKLSREAALTVELVDVERKLKRFEDAEHRAILTAFRRRHRQQREWERQIAGAADAAGRIDATAADLHPDELPDGAFDEESGHDRQAVAIITALGDAVRNAAEELRETARRLRDAVEKQRSAWNRATWQTEMNRAVADYEQFVKTLQAADVSDPSEYNRLVQERQRLDSENKALDSMRQERERLEGESKSRLGEILKARRAVSAKREAFLNETLAQNRFVRISGRRYGDDPRVIERSLRDVLDVRDDRFEDDILVMDDDRAKGGFVAELLRMLPKDAEGRSNEIERRIDRFKERVVSAINGSAPFGGHFNNYLERECKRNPDLLDKLLAWFPEDGLQVEYSRRGDGTDFRPIDQASAGQRAAAMLAFLLAHGEEPLVLDQPEDDLDNHLIYDLVVRQIRENKLRRQIIVVTHNPNIVVNGDAEMLHALDFVRGQCVVQQSGSLQEAEMREEVCRVMEGGREAFKRRYRRLGPEPTDVR